MKLDLNLTSAFGGSETFEKLYDVVIVGAGPAGMSAAIYAKRKGLSTIIVAERIGGQVIDTTSVENYAGFPTISGQGLADVMHDHVKSLDIPLKSQTRVTTIKSEGTLKTLVFDDGFEMQAKAVILATGSKPRKLGVTGEEEFLGRGVAYCAICDGPLFSGMPVIVAGGGNSAVEAAIDLAKTSSHVTLVHRSQFRADQILLEKLKQFDNVEIHLETTIQSVYGEKVFKGIEVKDNKMGQLNKIEAAALFVEIGHLPNTDFLEGVVERSPRGEVIVDAHGATSQAGIFAAGDMTEVPYKQIIISAGEGAKVALAANEYINKL